MTRERPDDADLYEFYLRLWETLVVRDPGARWLAPHLTDENARKSPADLALLIPDSYLKDSDANTALGEYTLIFESSEALAWSPVSSRELSLRYRVADRLADEAWRRQRIAGR